VQTFPELFIRCNSRSMVNGALRFTALLRSRPSWRDRVGLTAVRRQHGIRWNLHAATTAIG